MRGPLAATGVLPGSAMPSASVAMCIELAVPMPEHTPGPRMASRLMRTTRSTSIAPTAACMLATNTSSMSTWWPSSVPLGW